MEKRRFFPSVHLLWIVLLLAVPFTYGQLRDGTIADVDSFIKTVTKYGQLSEDSLREKFPEPEAHKSARLELESRVIPEISRFVDFSTIVREVCKGVCEKYWTTAGEKKSFEKLFKNLISQVAYPKAYDFFKKIKDIRFGTPRKVSKTREMVNVWVTYPINHASVEKIKLTFYLEEKEDKRLIVNFAVDGEEFVPSWRDQIVSILHEEQYPKLIERMQTKLRRVLTNSAL